MGFLIKKLVAKAAEKAAKIDPHDMMTQSNVSDIVTIIKGLLL